jgi:hypothetical protein
MSGITLYRSKLNLANNFRRLLVVLNGFSHFNVDDKPSNFFLSYYHKYMDGIHIKIFKFIQFRHDY